MRGAALPHSVQPTGARRRIYVPDCTRRSRSRVSHLRSDLGPSGRCWDARRIALAYVGHGARRIATTMIGYCGRNPPGTKTDLERYDYRLERTMDSAVIGSAVG